MIFSFFRRCIFCVSLIMSVNSKIDISVLEKCSLVLEEKPIMKLSIPKIDVFNNIYSVDSSLNNIDKNVQIMKYSDLPNEENSNVILGGHSGSGPFAFFKEFDKLSIGDDIYLDMNGTSYHYKITNIYFDSKDGNISISHNDLVNMITIFTCSPNDKNNYLVVIGELI